MAYKIIIHTSCYRGYVGADAPIRITNAMMDRLNGLSFRESNLQEVEWRLRTLMHRGWHPTKVLLNVGWAFDDWTNKHKKLTHIILENNIDIRVCFPEYPYRCKPFLDIDYIKSELSVNGSVILPFSFFYEEEDYMSNLDGCYVEILKC